jgi:predicted glycoside hydrolase/deacetylase ChbG (UPF0249 family)
MKHVLTTISILAMSLLISTNSRAADDSICLLVRGDDIGSSHASNVGCLESYKNGIVRSVELMPVGPWFLEAAELLNKHPDLDVGIHLALTSEWSRFKWRPLTSCPSLVDRDGYLFPMVWKNDRFPPGSSLQESDWKLDEIEKELRAQIELALKYVPHISHMGGHMGFAGLDTRISKLMGELSKEYHLEVDLKKHAVQRFPGWGKVASYEDRIDAFCRNLEQLTPGKYIFIEHPARDWPEMRSIGHVGYENVAADREWVTRVFTSEKVKQIIQQKGITLISYRDLR